jgi:cytoplasmic iron level regulating protein YaaA (DUF328/UPF0246 family)
MSTLLVLLSPAKLIDDQTHYPNLKCSDALFQSEAKQLVSKLKKLSPTELSELMDMSPALGEETEERYNRWKLPFTHQNAHPAILMFKGEVYRGLQAHELNRDQLEFAQNHVRILSGLYGIMRPLDLVLPYRLMMGTPFATDKKRSNLYDFWKDNITTNLSETLDKNGVIINLASQEYFKAIDTAALQRRVIQCDFKEKKNNAFVTVNTYTKLARGLMARFIIDHNIKVAEDIQAFDTDRYSFNKKLSDSNHFVFTR